MCHVIRQTDRSNVPVTNKPRFSLCPRRIKDRFSRVISVQGVRTLKLFPPCISLTMLSWAGLSDV